MYEKTTRQFFVDNLHPLDMVTYSTKFFGQGGRYCQQIFMTRNGKLLGKEISDGHGVEETQYYKAV